MYINSIRVRNLPGISLFPPSSPSLLSPLCPALLCLIHISMMQEYEQRGMRNTFVFIRWNSIKLIGLIEFL